MLIVQIIDPIISLTPDIFQEFTISPSGISLFIAVCIVYIFGQFFILKVVKGKIRESKTRPFYISIIERVVTIVQYFPAAVIVIIIQTLYSSQYNTGLLTINATISYGLASCLMGVLAYWLFSWFKISRSFCSPIIWFGCFHDRYKRFRYPHFFDIVIVNKPSIVTPQSEMILVSNFPSDDPMSIVATVQAISLNAYFALTWGGTIMLLYHNLKRIGEPTFWILVTTPLLFFMGFYITFYEALNPPAPRETLLSAIAPLLIIIFSAIAAVM
jgi:hypothetical protein